MKIIALIGARANPKGEEWLLGGYNLIEWSYTAACHSKYIGKKNIIISSNSKILFNKLINQTGRGCWINRPNELATNTATDFDWINHA